MIPGKGSGGGVFSGRACIAPEFYHEPGLQTAPVSVKEETGFLPDNSSLDHPIRHHKGSSSPDIFTASDVGAGRKGLFTSVIPMDITIRCDIWYYDAAANGIK